MPPRTDILDVASMRLSPGEGRRLELDVVIDPLSFAGERYAVEPAAVTFTLDVARMVGNGYSLRLRGGASLSGPCMRCLAPATPDVEIDAREIHQPGADEQLHSPYFAGSEVDLRAWARDALALALPAQLVCRPDCAGLCPVCGADLNLAGPEHLHEREPDPRWAKLRELELE
ncbi:MAG TPA: DUF177 domain-containing protein [Solirubrobacteraceae bacterium]|nr:DUF177 domain-containing protein [Solirubrobacteraceae bacterium]